MIDSIIFDLDGTLWNCSDSCIEVWNEVLKSKGIDAAITRQKYESALGLQHDKFAQKLLPFLTDAERREVMEEIDQAEVRAIKKRGGKLFNNTIPVLRKLSKAFPLFIVSNCQQGYIEAFLEYYQLYAMFADFESSGNTGRGKAHNIKSIIERNDLKHPVYIGDTLTDLRACAEAGIPFIYADYGFGRNVETPHQISDMGDLINTDILKHFD